MHRKAKVFIMFATSVMVMAFSGVAFAQEAGMAEVAKYGASGWIALGAGLGLGIAAFGGALGQGRAAVAALEGIARNPGASDKVFTPFILALALIESLVIYALVVSILLYLKMA